MESDGRAGSDVMAEGSDGEGNGEGDMKRGGSGAE